MRFRVDGLLPSGSTGLLVAQAKAGKTTLLLNLVRCALSGEPLLGRFPVARVRGRFVLVNVELSELMLAAWLRDVRAL